MRDYISRQAAIELAQDMATAIPLPKTVVKEVFNKIPYADVRESVRGEWQPIEVQPYFKKHFDTSVACSVCHRKGNKRYNFCPNCGADMRGDKL